MPKYRIEVRELQSDHMLASPEFKKNIYVIAKSKEDAERYILNNLKDDYGNKFKKADRKTQQVLQVDFTSRTGSIVLHEYKEPNFKRV